MGEGEVGEENGALLEAVTVLAGGNDGGDVGVKDDGSLCGRERRRSRSMTTLREREGEH